MVVSRTPYLDQLKREAIARRERLSAPPPPMVTAPIPDSYLKAIDRICSRHWDDSDSRWILRTITDITHVRRQDLEGPYRTATICKARHLAYYWLRQCTKLSMPQVGRLVGHRDHATILHGVRKVKNRPQDFEPWLSQIAARLGASIQ